MSDPATIPRKLPRLLTPQERIEIVRRAVAKEHGVFVEAYREIAAAFGVTLPCISQTVRRAGVAPRRGSTGRRRKDSMMPKRLPCEALTLAEKIKATRMYLELAKKVGGREALRLMKEHVRVKGLPDERSKHEPDHLSDDGGGRPLADRAVA